MKDFERLFMKKFIVLFVLLVGFCFISEIRSMAFQRFNEQVDELQAILDHRGPLAPHQQAVLEGLRQGDEIFAPLDEEAIRLDLFIRRSNGEVDPVPRPLAEINPGLHRMLAQADARYPRLARHGERPRRVAGAQPEVTENFVQKHPYYTAGIVVVGVAVIALAVDVVVRRKKSLVGQLIYGDDEEDGIVAQPEAQ